MSAQNHQDQGTITLFQTDYLPILVESSTVKATDPPQESADSCVVATVAVYLRPTASDDSYPIMPLPHRARIIDLGARDGVWWFVQYKDKQGWVHSGFL